MYSQYFGPSNFGDVGKFHARFNLPHVNTYEQIGERPIDPDLMDFRVRFMEEELNEFKEGLAEGDHAKMFDALIDLTYVAMGTAHMQGYPWQQGWDRVQAANMAKVRAQSDGSDSKRGSSFDVVKPKGWTPPDIKGLLRLFGWGSDKENNA
jgi:predicted HAD superfamily Cof-like phosphohydrolase